MGLRLPGRKPTSVKFHFNLPLGGLKSQVCGKKSGRLEMLVVS